MGSALAQAPHVAAPSTTNDGSCPADMQLVAGDYCSDVEFHCLKSWYDEPNKKTVCEDFEPTSKCVGSKSPKRFCIDRYAWPNVKDERPEVMNNFYQAQVKCAAVGKRLCTESEWTMACEGPEMKPFPYGYKRDVNKCNGDQPWDKPDMSKVRDRDPDELARLWHGVRNGQQPQCVSDYGVADLAGNTDDVVSNEETKGEYNSLCTGGPWYKGVRNQCRPKIYTHDEGFYYYYLSFRCCAESDGQTSDPRTPRQKKKNEDFKSVERLARFSVDQMKQKLELKKQGQCTCAAKDILCKTMCGTLLGPGAKDVVLSPSKP
ncbi:MAG TPA: SUMF1/EgtB/PvdO family nonheme iron enzyme [Polyangiaceae bacterium]|nr:SUMF1/EgtB/PvdO family nonheme iron enzyme [Polyangiaceae bacterium]